MKFFRASILYFRGDPNELGDKSYRFFNDGLLVVDKGKVVACDSYKKLKKKFQKEINSKNFFDHSGKYIFPGFIDTHIHYPQMEMTASYGEELLEWLEYYTFPTETKFKSKTYAKKIANLFLGELLKNGTTTALVFPTVHPQSVDAFFEEAQKRKLRMICGKVLMDRNAPKALLDTPEKAYKETKKLIKKWHKLDRLLYAVTPRFAITSSKKQLEVVSRLLEEHPDVYLQTHLAENHSEIEFVKKLFPKSKSYLDVYDQYNMTGRNSVFAHCIHLKDRDYKVMAKTQSNISFCPTSNLFLGSGFFNINKCEKHKINVGLGTDIGAGTSFSILQTMNEAYKVINVQKSLTKNKKEKDMVRPLDPFKAFYLATLGGAKALNLEGVVGSFVKGAEADFIIVNPKLDKFLDFRLQNTKNLKEKLFAIKMLANSNVIERTFIMGKATK